ncbi:MAG: MFS transporter, partial [Caldivirga sp.]
MSSVIEESGWGLVHTIALVSFSLSTMIEAYIYSISYIATGWVSVPRYLTALLTIWPPLWLLIGGVTMGPLSDLIGRRNTLYLTLLMYIMGAIGLTIGGGYLTLLLFLSLLLMATGGEYNTVMVATHEYFPRRVRSRVV